MSIIDHILLYLLLFIFYYFWGINNYNKKDKLEYWLLALVPIFLYAFIVGSRYGWGNDYLFYKYRLEHAFTYPEEQIGFKWLNQLINIIGLNYVGGYIVYSLIFITSAFVLIRSYKRYSKYMYAFLIPASLIFVSFAIRQGVALSFVLLAIYFLNKKNWIGFVLSTLIAFSIHSAIATTILIIGVFYLSFKKPLNWKITIPLYLFFTFAFDVKKIGIITDYTENLSIGNIFQSYLENSDKWFGKDAAIEIYEQSTFALITSSLFYISIIYLGYKALENKFNSQIVYLYNSVVFGIILYRAVFLFEILRRIAEPLVLLYFIPLGYSIHFFQKEIIHKRLGIKRKSNVDISLQYKFGVGCVLVFLILYFGRFIFLNPKSMFFWNK